MFLKKIALKEVLSKENIEISSEVITENGIIIIPKQIKQKDYLDSYSISIIKKMKMQIEKVHIAKRKDELKYSDFRGGEYELPLMLMKEFVIPIFIGIISAWLYDKIKNYKKSKEIDPKNPLIQEPKIKVRG